MAKNIGVDSVMALETETTWNGGPTGANADDAQIAFQSHGIDRVADRDDNANLNSFVRDDVVEFLKRMVGPVSTIARYEGGLEIILLHFLGKVSTSVGSPSSGANTHTFTLSADDADRPAGLAATILNGASSRMQLTGGKITGLRFSVTNRGLVYGFDWLGPEGTWDDNGTDPLSKSISSAPKILPCKDVTLSVQWDSTRGGGFVALGGNTKPVREIDIDMSWPHQEDRGDLGNCSIVDPGINDFATIGLTIRREHVNQDFITHMLNSTGFSIKITYTSSQNISGSTSPYNLILDFPMCRVVGGTPKVDGPGIVPEEIQIEALPAPTDYPASMLGEAVVVTLQNGVADVTP